MKALIIDDEIDICYLLSSILRNKSVQTTYVNSIRDAKNALVKDEPEIIFLDNHLPDGMGVDFIEYVKKNHPSIKIIMITAYDTTTDRNKAISAGADLFIAKPFTRNTIHEMLEQFNKLNIPNL